MNPLYLRRTQAAEYIRSRYGIPCQPRTLAKRACIGGGPLFRKAGRFPIYSPPDLDAWAEAQIGRPQHSTSEQDTNESPSSALQGGRK
jgi:hypothetical protein